MSVNEISINVEKEVTEVKTATITIADIVRILKKSAEDTLDGYHLYESEVSLESEECGNECTVTLSADEVNIEDKICDIFDDGEILIEEFLDKQYNAVDEEETKKTAAKKTYEEGENGSL
jgi:hypothetical protein